MKEKKKNFHNRKDAAILTGQGRNTVPAESGIKEDMSAGKLIINTAMRSTDFALKRGRGKRKSLPKKVTAVSQISGSHSLTALHYFKSSGR